MRDRKWRLGRPNGANLGSHLATSHQQIIRALQYPTQDARSRIRREFRFSMQNSSAASPSEFHYGLRELTACLPVDPYGTAFR
jgi:hypothetical protein